MLQALTKTENDISHILDIVRIDQCGGEQFYTTPSLSVASPVTFPSIAERTLNCYSNNATKQSDNVKKMECFSCGGPHTWSKNFCGTYKIVCPNANQPGLMDCAKLNIKHFQTHKKKHMKDFKKRKNILTLNWEDIPLDCHKVIFQQQCSLMWVVTAEGNNSTASSLASTTCGPRSRPSVILHQDAEALTTEPPKPPIPITIHSPMAHVTLQTGLCDETKDCPGI
jgi:hypothetical protein